MGFKSYVVKRGKKYRRGYTTGSAAAAAAKAATRLLFNEEKTGEKGNRQVVISTPAGIELQLKGEKMKKGVNFARAAVIKDAGDDPDVTDGLYIQARVKEINTPGIELTGGRGVGQVTAPGLPVSEGKAAINPVPRQMIKKEVQKVLPVDHGVKVTIEVPGGERVAEKTFNPRLGITGGISILGTTGIVEPMSKKAYRESLALELKQALARGEKKIILVFGNQGRKLALERGYREQTIIRMSNFVGYMLDECLRLGVEEITIIGQIGKIVKVAGGIFNTHSQTADARREIIAAYTARNGGSQELIKKILRANTTEEAVELLIKADRTEVFAGLARKVVEKVEERTANRITVTSIIFSLNQGVLAEEDEGEGRVDKDE